MINKKDANYRMADATDPDSGSCGACVNFIPPDNCKAVSGVVSSAGLCDLYEAKPQQQGNEGTDSLMAQLFGNTQGGQ